MVRWALRAPSTLLHRLHDHRVAPGIFTLVAGTCVLGSGFAILFAFPVIAFLALVSGLSFWLLFTYYFFTVMTASRARPSLTAALDGDWMLIVVSTQSVSILSTLVSGDLTRWGEVLLGVSVSLFLLGALLYILLFTLVLYRFLFFPVDPIRFTPPYWITMGAVAITTLAGALLALDPRTSVLLSEFRPFIIGSTLLAWVTATWWIPLLVSLGLWRHLVRRVPIRYDIEIWSMIFPLGMYAVCTYYLIELLGWTGLNPIASGVGGAAILLWVLAAIGLGRLLTRIL